MSAAPALTSGPLSVFQFDAWRVRVIDRDGQPWWVLKDVCEALGLTNAAMVAERLTDDEKLNQPDLSSLGQRGGWLVNESGLYKTIFRSDKPEARRFETWITSEVLPEIRRTGSYTVPGFQVPKNMVEALRLAADLEEKRLSLETKIAEDAPKVACAEALMVSERTMSITDCAKHFGLHPKAEVFPYLRDRGYLTEKDLPTQAALDAGYLSLKQVRDSSGNLWPQAVVEVWQLERWRAHVVHQVKAYCRPDAQGYVYKGAVGARP